jgi:hypothetical protein
LSLSRICYESLKAQYPDKSFIAADAKSAPEANAKPCAKTSAARAIVDMDESVDQTTFLIPDDGLISLNHAIRKCLDSDEFRPNCVSCKKPMALEFSAEDPGLLVIELGSVQNKYGSTAQAIQPATITQCLFSKSRYQLAGIVYWHSSPRHFTAEILMRTRKHASFYYYDDLDGGKLKKTAEKPLQQLKGKSLRANAVLMFYERVSAAT